MGREYPAACSLRRQVTAPRSALLTESICHRRQRIPVPSHADVAAADPDVVDQLRGLVVAAGLPGIEATSRSRIESLTPVERVVRLSELVPGKFQRRTEGLGAQQCERGALYQATGGNAARNQNPTELMTHVSALDGGVSACTWVFLSMRAVPSPRR